MKKLFSIVAIALAFAACGEVEPVVYNGSSEDVTFISFSRSAYFLPVERDATGEVVVTLNSSTVSNADRVYNIEIDQELSSASPETYNIPNSVVIPAGSYQGTFTITGQDLDLVEAQTKPVYIRISNLDNESVDSNQAIINIGEVCSLSEGVTFTGEYRVNQQTAGFPWVQGGTPILAQNSVVTLAIGASQFERVFSASVYPGVINAPANFSISLGCDFVNLGSIVNTGIRCTDTPETNSLKFAPSESPSPYSRDDDSEFFLTLTEEATSACTTPRETTIKFTKVQ